MNSTLVSPPPLNHISSDYLIQDVNENHCTVYWQRNWLLLELCEISNWDELFSK